MSLLVFSTSSKIAQGIVRHLYGTNKYEKIVCTDLYPSYKSIQGHTEFLATLDTVQSKTKVSDYQIIEKSDITRQIQKASHVLYITHDHYQNCASKLNLIKNIAKITAEQPHLKKFVALTPVELDNWAETDPIGVVHDSEKDAFKANSKMVLVKSDLTFGSDSSFMTRIISRLVNRQNLLLNPVGGGPAPIHTSDLASGIETLLENNTVGDQFLAQGEKRVDWTTVFNILESITFIKRQSSPLERILSPLSNNLLSEAYHCRKYMNLAQFVNKYHPPSHIGYTDFKQIQTKLTDFETYTKEQKIDHENYRIRESAHINYLISRVQ